MANLQYNGARYVPKFYENSLDPSSCDWENDVSYEPLTIVTYNDDSYTSKKFVPSNIGNPADNSQYWALTGNFNASLIALQNEVNDISDNLDDTMKTVEKTTNNGLGNTQISVFTAKEPAYWNGIANSTHTILQGSAYDSKRNRLCYMLLNPNDEYDIMLVTVDYADHTTVFTRQAFTNNEFRHGGDFCYNPNIDRYVICGDPTYGKIYYIEPLTLTIVGTMEPIGTPPLTARMGGIAYDTKNDMYYAMCSIGMYKFSGTLGLIELIEINYRDLITSNINFDKSADENFSYNCIECYEDKIVTCFMVSGGSNSSRENVLVLFNKDFSIFSTMNFKQYHSYTEIESLDVINNELHGMSRWFVFNDVILLTQKGISNTIGVQNIDSALSLQAGTDLNDLYNPTLYICYNSDVAKSLSHCPTEYPFILSVNWITPYACEQKLVCYIDGTTIEYNRTNGGNSWGSWSRNVQNRLGHGMSYSTRGIYSGYAASKLFALHIPNFFVPNDITSADITITFSGTFMTIDGAYSVGGNTTLTQNELTPSLSFRNQNGGSIFTFTLPSNFAHPNTPLTFFGTFNVSIAAST